MANITQEKALELIRDLIRKEGSATKAAAALDISAGYLSEILNNNRPISEAVAKKLGYKRVVMFQKEEE